ncbi:MAG: HopJ type III effector protein [Gammaproteobacteria bacterium]|nr:HopJ type III effector protein [Gammaproteobacteria bacterium]
MDINQLVQMIKNNPNNIEFDDVIQVIDDNYQYTPARFSNGTGDNQIINDAGTNEGSCKIFAFAKINQLSKEETLACFGHYYHKDVLQHPDGQDHANIRNFMRDGWTGISFESPALT